MTGTKISAENLFSLPICVIMGLRNALPCVEGRRKRRKFAYGKVYRWQPKADGGIVKKLKISENNPSVATRQLPLHKGALGCAQLYGYGLCPKPL